MKKKIFAILLTGLVLRLISINQSLWLDEATTALVSQRSLGDYFTNFSLGDFHPPLYYLLSITVANIFGTSELAIRSISLVSGVLTVYIVYKITYVLSKNNRTALIAGLLLATSGLHVYYSHEARMYALAALFATTSVYYLLQNKWKTFGVSIAAMILTHYVTVFMLPVFGIYGYLSQKDMVWWKQFLSSHLFILLGFGLWLPVFYKQLTAGLGVESTTPLWWSILGKTTPKEIALVPAKFLFGRIAIENNMLYLLVTGFVGAVFASIMSKSFSIRKHMLRTDKAALVWLWLIVPTVLAAVMGLWVPVFSYFRLLFVLPALYVLLGIGIEKLKKPIANVALVFVLLVNISSASVYLFNQRFHREDWRGLVNYVADRNFGNDQVVFVSDSQKEAYSYYFDKRQFAVASCILPTTGCANPVYPSDKMTFDRSSEGGIWLMRYVQPIFDPSDDVRKEIESLGYETTSEHDFNGIVVWRYEL